MTERPARQPAPRALHPALLELVRALARDAASGGSSRSYVADRWVVRRLTPDECEALQGFPRGYTAGQADGPRYKQLGNSWAVNVARWIGERIDAALRRQREEAA